MPLTHPVQLIRQLAKGDAHTGQFPLAQPEGCFSL